MTGGSIISSNYIGFYGHGAGNVFADGSYVYGELLHLQNSSSITSSYTAVYADIGPCGIITDAGTSITSTTGYGIHFYDGIVTSQSRIVAAGTVNGRFRQIKISSWSDCAIITIFVLILNIQK